MGGIGNRMFQLASIYSVAKQTGHDFCIRPMPMPPEKHSDLDYAQRIFQPWQQFVSNDVTHTREIYESCGYPYPLSMYEQIPNSEKVHLIGHFQHYPYIEPFKKEITDLFAFDMTIIDRSEYDDLSDAYFLHVRRGDYINNSSHFIDLSNYYKRAVDHIGTGVAYIVSNDNEWCEDWEFLKDIRHKIIYENEIDSLALIKSCQKGGICANSTFSWWGLYLNTNRPYLIIPDRWTPHGSTYEKGYQFPGTMQIQTL
jgi:hypothetical protein